MLNIHTTRMGFYPTRWAYGGPKESYPPRCTECFRPGLAVGLLACRQCGAQTHYSCAGAHDVCNDCTETD